MKRMISFPKKVEVAAVDNTGVLFTFSADDIDGKPGETIEVLLNHTMAENLTKALVEYRKHQRRGQFFELKESAG